MSADAGGRPLLLDTHVWNIATARLLGAALVTRDERMLDYARQGHVRVIDATPR